jgi:hypothetical protein
VTNKYKVFIVSAIDKETNGGYMPVAVFKTRVMANGYIRDERAFAIYEKGRQWNPKELIVQQRKFYNKYEIWGD